MRKLLLFTAALLAMLAGSAKAATNATWVCYSRFEDAPVAMSIGQFQSLTTVIPLGATTPYWTTGFIPFAQKTTVGGQSIGNGYSLHCNVPNAPLGYWVGNDGGKVADAGPFNNAHAAAVAYWGATAKDGAGNPQVFNYYPVVG